MERQGPSGSVNPSGNCIARIEVDRLGIGYGDDCASAHSRRLLILRIYPLSMPPERDLCAFKKA
jgi:hypothetical protein